MAESATPELPVAPTDEPEPERWLPVAGYEGLYFVSDLGRVRSVKRSSTSGVILKPWSDEVGRLYVKLSKNNVEKTRRVHTLVAEAFIGPRPEGQETRHLNDDPADNRLVNLTYGTSKQNKADMMRNAGHYQRNKTHCINNHEFTEANTRIRERADGSYTRECRACGNEASQDRTRRIAAGEIDPGACTFGDCPEPVVALDLCRLHYERQNSGRPLGNERACPQCGETFVKPPGRKSNGRKYCSDACSQAAKRH